MIHYLFARLSPAIPLSIFDAIPPFLRDEERQRRGSVAGRSVEARSEEESAIGKSFDGGEAGGRLQPRFASSASRVSIGGTGQANGLNSRLE